MDFSEALIALKKGHRVLRLGWNGKGMHVTHKTGYRSIPCNEEHASAHKIDRNSKISYLPYLEMKTAQGDYVPWLASQTDILAEDWEIKED